MHSLSRSLSATIIAACCWVPVAGAQSDLRLPDIGASASQVLSPQQEREIGEQMMRYFRGIARIIDDPIAQGYIEDLGFRLVAHSERPQDPFTFFIVRANQVNAFAAPGGFIGVHSGLILTAETEDELAAVLAHEIAHVTQRHIVRRFESASKANLPIALAMIGALVAASGSNNASAGDVAQAAVVGGTALMQQNVINFTRANEYEADWIGMRTLARAGFEPEAMASFFGRMGRLHRAFGESLPEYLRTHPVTTTRIAEARARAAQLETVPMRADQLRFLLVRERLRVLGAEQPMALVARYRDDLAAGRIALDPQIRYGKALALTRAGRPEEALALLEPLLEHAEHALLFRLARAQALEAAQDWEQAAALFEELNDDHPGNLAVLDAYGEALLRRGEPASARRAQQLLRPLAARADARSAQIELLARASAAAGDEIRAGELFAEVAFQNGRLREAMNQLTRLAQRPDLDFYQRARIDARRAAIEPLLIESQRRGDPQS